MQKALQLPVNAQMPQISKILIIEDDALIRENLIDLLEAEKYSVIDATNGLEGIELAVKNLPDLILCDIMMPIKDGFDVVREIRADKRTRNIRFVFLTAKAEKTSLRQGMMLADDYITKPFSREELLDAIAAQLERAEAVKDFLNNFADNLRKKLVQEVREEIGKRFPDRVGNILNQIAGCFTLLADAETPGERDYALENGLRAIAELYAIWMTYLKTKK
jgi:CheY-like chemotaxis protein